jgi:uncharacterized coiled-coil DUF342 family protein
LRGRIDELSLQLNNANGELRELRQDVGQLRCHNDIASQEIDDLRTAIERMRSSGTNADSESEGDSDRRRKRRRKGKKPVRSSDEDDELNEDAARVRNIF